MPDLDKMGSIAMADGNVSVMSGGDGMPIAGNVSMADNSNTIFGTSAVASA